MERKSNTPNLRESVSQKVSDLAANIDDGLAILDMHPQTYQVAYETELSIGEISQLIDLLITNDRMVIGAEQKNAKYILEISSLNPMITDGFDDKKIVIKRIPQNSNQPLNPRAILFK